MALPPGIQNRRASTEAAALSDLELGIDPAEAARRSQARGFSQESAAREAARIAVVSKAVHDIIRSAALAGTGLKDVAKRVGKAAVRPAKTVM